jgi:hypothetical protein
MWREGEGKREQGRNHTPRAFGKRREARFAHGIGLKLAGPARPARSLAGPLQELGTIEAGSKVEITGPSKA